MSPGRESPEEVQDEETSHLYQPIPRPIPIPTPSQRADAETPRPGWDGETAQGPGRRTRQSSETVKPAPPRPGWEGETGEGSGQRTCRPTGAETGPFGPGQILFDKYQIVRKLGDGAMGEVWLVRHLDLDVERALKRIISAVAFNDELRARFRREARVMARFTHPNAVTVHDAVVRPDDHTAYIEMEFVQGQVLKDLLIPDVPMPLDWTARIVAQLCDVLQVAHEKGIVHRDLKPGNLMLVDGRKPGHEQLKVLDFGIAKIRDGDLRDPEDLSTRAGTYLGTPQYMSPEQWIADPDELDARSDLYSVGVLLYELLTGRRPFQGTQSQLRIAHLQTAPPPLAEKNPDLQISPEIGRVVLRCLEKDPGLRPQSARELAEEFARAMTPPPCLEEEPLCIEEEPRKTRPWLRAGVVAAFLLSGLIAGTVSWFLFTPSFTLDVEPSTLRLQAGGPESTVSVIQRRYPWSELVPINFSVDSRAIEVKPLSDSGPATVVFPYQVAADLNIAPTTRSATLTFEGTSAGFKVKKSIKLKIDPPGVSLPPHCIKMPGATLVRVGASIYPDRIVHDFQPSNLEPLVFLLVNQGGRDDPDPFYIMENKVWRELFARYARENLQRVASNKVWRPIAEGEDWPEAERLFPATDLTATEARGFAARLGGQLPTCKQWDKAAGLDQPDGRLGPFDPAWTKERHNKNQIAVDRADEGFLPVGKATLDVSPPVGCRDMAGNGREWTRDAIGSSQVILRGRSYEDRGPLLYKDLKAAPTQGEAESSLKATLYVGFRVVIEIQ